MESDAVSKFRTQANEKAAKLHEHILSLPAERFRGQPWTLIAAIEEFATSIQLPMLFRRPKIDVVRGVLAALEPKPKLVVEFGTFVGTSALAWGAILKELNGADAAGGVRVYTCELNPKLVQTARDLLELAGLDDVVSVLEGPGSDSLKKLYAEGKVKEGQLDMVFLDHWEKFYLPDLRLCEELKLFRKGSVAVADNTDYPGAPKYLEYVKKGGSGEAGSVRYESKSLLAKSEAGASVVEVSEVVET